MPANLRILRGQIREVHLAIHALRQNPKIGIEHPNLMRTLENHLAALAKQKETLKAIQKSELNQ